MDLTNFSPMEEFAHEAYAEESPNEQHPAAVFDYFPYLLHDSRVSIDSHTIPDYGILSKDNMNDQQTFLPWGSKNLTINRIEKDNGIELNEISGLTSSTAGGFVLENLTFDDRFVFLLIGNIEKSRPSQLSFALTVEGSGNEFNLIFVHGPLHIKGWNGTNYYEQIDAYSSKLIDLDELLESHATSFSLRKATIVIQKDVSISAEFRIDLVEDSDSGNIRTEGSLMYDREIFHNLGFTRLVTIQFWRSGTFNNSSIMENGWDVISVKEKKDDKSGVTTLELTAEKPTSKSALEVLLYLDIYQSMLTLGSKDWLFIIISVVSVLIYPHSQLFRRRQ
jgi:hypothetical protein